ncbi:methyltransferase domain-containing protein [Candidatus Woesearchaeota archaeon]|nr:methyltransferase domain-containing protein [Candidatus Woesearchaeota archaeon]
MKLLIEQQSGKKYLVRDITEDFHTFSGVISCKDLKSKKNLVVSNTGKKFLQFTPTFPDIWEQLQRGPQAVLQKDIGLIIAKTGINGSSVVVDAGGGSGSLCLALANLAKKVIVYERNPEHYKLLARNITQSGIKNIELHQENIYDGIAAKEVDIITLDLPEPWRAIPAAEKVLVLGGHLVVYLPNLTQVQIFTDAVRKSSIKIVETIELLERKWKVEGEILRPEFQMLGHTGFLTFCRKLHDDTYKDKKN